VAKTGRFVDHQDTPHKVCALGHTRLQQVLRGHERRHVRNVDVLGGHRKETVDGRQLPINPPLRDTIWPTRRRGRTLRETHDFYFGRAPMAVASKRERALQVVLVVLGLLLAPRKETALAGG